jgi:hypothetical protein
VTLAANSPPNGRPQGGGIVPGINKLPTRTAVRNHRQLYHLAATARAKHNAVPRVTAFADDIEDLVGQDVGLVLHMFNE